MQAALISYVMFTAVFLLLVIIVITIVVVRSLLTFIRGRRDKSSAISGCGSGSDLLRRANFVKAER